MIVPTEPTRASAAAHRVAGRAEIEREIEPPQHRGQPLGEIGGDAIEQERLRPRGARAAAARAQQPAIEDQRACGMSRRSGHDLPDWRVPRRARIIAKPMTVSRAQRLCRGVKAVPIAAWRKCQRRPVSTARLGSAPRTRVRALLRARARSRFAARCARPAASRSKAKGSAPACWSKLSFIAPALLRAARHSLRLRSRPRHPVDGGDRRSAGLPARPRRRALRRHVARAGACAQIWRPARPRADDGPLDGARRARSSWPKPTRSCRCRCTGGGCGRGASTSRPCWRQPCPRRAACRSRDARAQAREGHRAAGRAVAHRARRQRAGRLPGRRPTARPRSPAAGSSWSTTCSPRARPSMPAPGRCCAPAPATSTCWCSPGLLTPARTSI